MPKELPGPPIPGEVYGFSAGPLPEMDKIQGKFSLNKFLNGPVDDGRRKFIKRTVAVIGGVIAVDAATSNCNGMSELPAGVEGVSLEWADVEIALNEWKDSGKVLRDPNGQFFHISDENPTGIDGDPQIKKLGAVYADNPDAGPVGRFAFFEIGLTPDSLNASAQDGKRALFFVEKADNRSKAKAFLVKGDDVQNQTLLDLSGKPAGNLTHEFLQGERIGSVELVDKITLTKGGTKLVLKPVVGENTVDKKEVATVSPENAQTLRIIGSAESHIINLTPTVLPSLTATVRPTETRPATVTPTKTEVPRLDIPVVTGSEGGVRVDLTYERLLEAHDIAKQLGEEPLSPAFFRKLLNYLYNTTLGDGQPIINHFNAETVSNTPWITMDLDTLGRSDTLLDYKKCMPGDFCVKFPFAFKDMKSQFTIDGNPYNMFFVLQQIRNVQTGDETVTPIGFIGQLHSTLKNLHEPGKYFAYTHHFRPEIKQSHMTLSAQVMRGYILSDGTSLYDNSAVDQFISQTGIFSTYFQTHPLTGAKYSLGVC